MKSVYKIKPYSIFCAYRDRGLRASEDTVSRTAAALENGETIIRNGYKFKPEGAGRVRVYDVREPTRTSMVSHTTRVRRI